MKILFVSNDIFNSIGGGQTFFKKRIEQGRDQFYYFTTGGSTASPQPHVHVIPITDLYRSKRGLTRFSDGDADLARLGGKEGDFLTMMDYAASVAGRSFDVVEIPDYLPFAALLPDALRYHGVKFDRVVLSMHGTLSNVLRDNWSGDKVGDLSTLMEFEELLYRVADVRYGIGGAYTREWTNKTSFAAELVDVASVFNLSEFSLGKGYDAKAATPDVPDLCFVGRHEKCKGPDLFVDICSRLPRDSHNAPHIIGPEVVISGHRSSDHLNRMASLRDLDLVHQTLTRDEILRRFKESRSVAMFPSRLDTFNLAALESILSGCPTVISRACGIVEYFEHALPGLPFISLDLNDVDGVFPALRDLLADYDGHRDRLREFLATNALRPHGTPLKSIYSVVPTPDLAARARVRALFDSMARLFDRTAKRTVAGSLDETLGTTITNLTKGFSGSFNAGELRNIFRLSNALADSEETYRTLIEENGFLPAESSDALIQRLRPFVHSGNRVAAYRLLAEIERERGNDLLHATYWLRVMRLSGRRHPKELSTVVDILKREGFAKEAKAAALLYGGAGEDEIFTHLMNVKGSFMTPPRNDLEMVRDFRRVERPKVSIIVSVYNGAGKVRNFLRGLGRLTESTKAVIEVVFVDSGSPDATPEVLPREIQRSQEEGWGISALYARSRERETIQTAWNRGITLARGEYLSFLGVDEMNTPDAFDIMIDYLDRNSAVDWVQGNTIVTDVDAGGGFVRDVMPYRRVFHSQDMHYLDCCYIGYVGALYRRSIHERLGFYDGSFRGAGDVEFKNRVLPWVSVRTLDRNLGVFLNYPEERTTQSPVAELEDLAAWYLHRSIGGVRYAFGERDVEDIVKLFDVTMSYRKSYMDLDCTDVELGATLAEHLQQYQPSAYGRISRFRAGLLGIQSCYREVDEINKPGSGNDLQAMHWRAGAVETGVFTMTKMTQLHRDVGKNTFYAFTNDNRSHQHHGIWASAQRRFSLEFDLSFGDLAGPQDLAELLSSAGATGDEVDFERAWATGKSAQVKRLFERRSVAAFFPGAGGHRTSIHDAFVARVEGHLAPKDRSIAVFLGVNPNASTDTWTDPRVAFSGVTRSRRPYFAAARVVIFPVFKKDAAAADLVEAFCQAAAFGKPMLATSEMVAAVRSVLPGLDVSGVETRDDPDAFLLELEALIADPSRRSANAARVENLRTALARRQEIRHAPGTLAPTGRRGTPIEWTEDVAKINRLVRQVFEGADADNARGLLEAMIATEPATRRILSETLIALFVTKTAPILSTDQPVFRAIAALASDPDLDRTLERLGLRSH